jgi:transposase
MLSLPSGIKIYIASNALDMRKSFDGMAYLVSKELQQDVYSGSLFVFCNKRGDKIKIFYWDRNGYCCWYKRLERGIFRLPRVDDKVFKVSVSELNLLLEGIELTHRQRLTAC